METNTNQHEALKRQVKEKYTQIADQSKEENETSCCGIGSGCNSDTTAIMAEDYSKIKGHSEEANLGLGCGIPTEFAQIKDGDTVIDLGSGAGNDAFVARTLIGTTGRVIGVDFTEKMIEKSRNNSERLGYNNVEFRYGDIEALPINNNVADVVLSNCVLNLVPNKTKAFEETYRVLKPGGHFSVSDIVLRGELPPLFKTAAELYSGCISGAINKFEYLEIIRNAGFENIQIQKEKVVKLPDDLLAQYGSPEEIDEFRKCGTEILSITIYAEKPTGINASDYQELEKKAACCGVDSEC